MADEEAIRAKIRENEAELERLRVEGERHEELRPLRMLLPLAQDAHKAPETIDWEAAISTLEEALKVARAQVGDGGSADG